MEKGTVFNIQPFSVYDGPGIRTTVFLKGCNLRCCWCHNPESIAPGRELQFSLEKCIGCGACLAVCPTGAHGLSESGVHTVDRALCTACGKCADGCFAGALCMTGETVTSDTVLRRVLTDSAYYKNSGGGVTFSGGEAMVQLPFLKELLTACRAHGVHTAVDTAGNFPFSSFEEILTVTDLFLYDIKAYDRALHRELTGVYNDRILENLPKLLERGAEVIVRVPCVPGGNWDDLEAIAGYLKALPIQRVELLAYHRLGEGKREALGRAADGFSTPTAEEMEGVLRMFTEQGVPAVYNK